MSPSRSKTIVLPSGDTSTDIHVPSLAVNAILRVSARGLLMSAAGSGFLSSSFGGSAAAAARERARASPRARSARRPKSRSRMRFSLIGCVFRAVEASESGGLSVVARGRLSTGIGSERQSDGHADADGGHPGGRGRRSPSRCATRSSSGFCATRRRPGRTSGRTRSRRPTAASRSSTWPGAIATGSCRGIAGTSRRASSARSRIVLAQPGRSSPRTWRSPGDRCSSRRMSEGSPTARARASSSGGRPTARSIAARSCRTRPTPTSFRRPPGSSTRSRRSRSATTCVSRAGSWTSRASPTRAFAGAPRITRTDEGPSSCETVYLERLTINERVYE